MAPMLNRRGALLALGGVAAAWTIPTLAAAQSGAVLAWSPRGLSMDEARTLAAACERILPATKTPGAAAFGVPQFVDRAIADWCEPADVERLKAGLARLDADGRAKFGAPFATLAAAQQDSILAPVEVEARDALNRRPHFFLLLRELATTGYFTCKPGATQVLRYDPVPGAFHGCVPLKDIGRGWAT